MGQPHPAPYSKPILDRLTRILATEERKVRAVDPFGGTARLLACMPQNSDTTIIEIETEFITEGLAWCGDKQGLLSTATAYGTAPPVSWRGQLVNGGRYDYVCGDSAKVLARRKKTYTHIITSPSYGNRFSDGFNPTEGRVCRSYAQSKGGALDISNGSAYRFFDPEYWGVHIAVIAAAIDRLEDDGQFILNVSDFYKTMAKGEAPTRIPVVPAWISVLHDLGMTMHHAEPVYTRRYKHGENRHRAEHEMLLTFRKA